MRGNRERSETDKGLHTAALPSELLELVKNSGGEVVEHEVQLGYDFWTAGELSFDGLGALRAPSLTCIAAPRRSDPASRLARRLARRVSDRFYASRPHWCVRAAALPGV